MPALKCVTLLIPENQLQCDRQDSRRIKMFNFAWHQGDIGDPAVHFSGVNRAGTLYGIALFSGTEECAYKSKPGVFAKVSNPIPL